ncbi:MAG: glycosyltransferase [Phycisphaeraceae bacterium]|nr:glycosyltransferase [Phycisphaeraceae bacterium]
MRIAYIIPTRNRHERLAATLALLGDLPAHDAEVVVVDNASTEPVITPKWLANGLPVVRRTALHNLGTAARNLAANAADPGADWLVMLDDDSHPLDLDWLDLLASAPSEVLAISADIHLPRLRCREAGGLPEVFVGCGVAIRRDAFVYAGGYDPAFGYYAEEYDLAARLLLAGGRIVFAPAFRIDHHKVLDGRNMNEIVYRLVRNNGWVQEQYAPEPARRTALREARRRCRMIAEKENARDGYRCGVRDLRSTRVLRRRTPMPESIWDRFIGREAARTALHAQWRACPYASVAIVEPGKHEWVIAEVLEEMGVSLAPPEVADALVIGTLSPGPMLDALEDARKYARRVIAPWSCAAEFVALPH